MDDFETQERIFDPNYQNNLFIIESALQDAGAIPRPEGIYPNIYDDQLRTLIDAVTLE